MAEHDFTHLRVHSHYSLLGGTASVADLARRAAADGLSALALTDSNALYGAVAFQNACEDAGVRPLLGMVLNVALPAELFEITAPDPLLLLAMNTAGWRSLCRLSTLVQNHPEREERVRRGVEWTALQENREGLICIAGGRRSWLEQLVRAGKESLALRLVGKLGGLFGEEQTYLALELHRPGDLVVAQTVERLGRRMGLPTVAVQPVYILHAGDREQLRLLAAIDANCHLNELPAEAMPDHGDAEVALHWLSPVEIAERFANFPAALARIGEIVERTTPCLPDGRPIWPTVELEGEPTPDALLWRKAHHGLQERYGSDAPAAVGRLERELQAIVDHGYAPLFLLVAEMVTYAHAQEIPVSTRGSVANCLVAYCLGITAVDPVAHDLLFERFLNPARTELPDIDLDFCSRRRDEVLAYLRQRYGLDRVALVATVNTFQLRSAVHESAKACGLTDADAGALARRIPRHWHPDPRRRQVADLDTLLAGMDDPLHREIVRRATALVGKPHHLSVHPGGVVITPAPLTDYAPLQHAPKGFAITQFDHGDVETLGLVKVDLLGIRALTVLADAARLIQRHHDAAFQPAQIPTDDVLTSTLLSHAETVGVFQCESTGAQRTLRQLKARTPHDLAVANAFFKPGPATGGMADLFVRRYRGEAPVAFLHPCLEPILRTTQGVLIFQEQILRVATEVAGLSWQEAEHLRRGMSKFRPDEMEQMRERFIAGCQRAGGPGLAAAAATTLWEQVAAFAGYGFNQGHATAYAAVSYRSAYLKAHYPAEFLCARLADWGGFHHQAVYIAEARRLGIEVRPPHVNQSGRRFTLAYERRISGERQPILYMGLGQVRNLRRATIQAMVAARKERSFTDLRDLVQRVELQPKELLHLIRCGALDGLGASRAALIHESAEIKQAGSGAQLSFGFFQSEISSESPAERIAWESRILGQPLSVHPLDIAGRPAASVPLCDLSRTPNRLLTTCGVRLPGWTGGKGFFLDDGASYVVAVPAKGIPNPPLWQPVTLRGRWREDPWGNGWLQIEGV
jgi:DNA polymerase III subunit alpha